MKDRVPQRRGIGPRGTETSPAPQREQTSARFEAVLGLQRKAGNAATSEYLCRAGAAGPVALQRQPAPAPPAPAVAAAVADAVNTQTRMTAVLQTMLRSSNRTVSNTAQLYTGASPRMSWTPMTRRSDSTAIAAQLGTTGTREYFFTGVTEPAWTPGGPLPAGTKVFEPSVAGTIQGNTALIRGSKSDGSARSDQSFSSILVHETSHVLVASYGEHPGNSASFDRYRDEFRAYFIDPFDSRFGALGPDAKATGIKNLLVGTSATNPAPATNAYGRLQAAYWTTPAFKAQVDGHKRPDGFNLTSSPRLDKLFQLLTAAAADPATVDDVVLAIIRLPIPERTEAAGATVIPPLLAKLAEGARNRVLRALGAPTSVEYTGDLNPDKSPRITAFYDALVRGDPAAIKTAYGLLNPADRGRLSMNAAALVFVDRHLDSVRNRACTVAMMNTGSVAQFDAVAAFISACLDELANAVLRTPGTAPSARTLAAVRAMSFESRLGFYRLTADARAQYVEVLPAPIAGPLIAILRGDRDP